MSLDEKPVVCWGGETESKRLGEVNNETLMLTKLDWEIAEPNSKLSKM